MVDDHTSTIIALLSLPLHLPMHHHTCSIALDIVHPNAVQLGYDTRQRLYKHCLPFFPSHISLLVDSAHWVLLARKLSKNDSMSCRLTASPEATCAASMTLSLSLCA